MGRKSESGGVRNIGGRVRLDFFWKGRRLRPTLDLTYNERNRRHATRLLEEIRTKMRHGVFDPSDYFPEYSRDAGIAPEVIAHPTFRAFAESWLASISSMAHSTRVSYSRTLNRYWLPTIGDKPIDSIRHTDLQTALGAFSFVTAKTRNNTLIPVRAVFEFARIDLPHLSNPAAAIRNGRVQTDPPDPFALEEVNDIVAHLRAKHDVQTANYFEAAFFTGMRPSEQIVVRWSDFGRERRELRVQRARVWGEDKASTKTYLVRDIELLERAFDAIMRQREWTATTGGSAGATAIFNNPNTRAAWADEQSQRKIWDATIRTLGLRHRPQKQTRHTFATLCLTAGANPAWVAEQMGHRSTKMFFDVYSKWIKGADNGREKQKVEVLFVTNSSLTLTANVDKLILIN